MPRSLRPASFGPEYEELLLVSCRNKGYTLTLPTRREAYLFRIRLYAYFKSLRKDSEVSGKSQRLARMSDTLKLSVAECEVRITMRSDEWDAAAIREALSMPMPSMPQAPDNTASLLSRLTLIRQKNKQ